MTRSILWADDEIDLLRPHIMFLEERGYRVRGVATGSEAVSEMKRGRFDIVFLDEMMPGMSGLDALLQIKELNPNVPVVMITKSQKEDLIDEALRKRIDDYLIKPVNPVQILSACRRLLDKQQIRQQQVSQDYLADFRELMSRPVDEMGWEDWIKVHVRLMEWDLELAR